MNGTHGFTDDELLHWADAHESLSPLARGIVRVLGERTFLRQEVRRLAHRLKHKTQALAVAVNCAESSPSTAEFTAMASPILQPLEDQIAATDTVIDSAIVLINGIQAQIATAVAAAIANGATAAELAPLTDLNAGLKAKTDALAASVAANTPAAPPTP